MKKNTGPSSRKSRDAPKKRRFWRHWVVDVLIVLLIILGFRAFQQRTIQTGTAPPIEGTTLDGQTIALHDLRGKPVLIHFWATWCEVCKAMEDNIDNIAREHKVITVASLSGSSEDVYNYIHQRKLSMPVVVDPQGDIARSYGISAFPTSIIIDKEGEISFTETGYTTEYGIRARLALAETME